MYNGTRIGAEVKTHSPFGKQLTKNTWRKQFSIADAVGDFISIHTNPIWRGSFEDIAIARKLTKKPILAKGFHETNDQVRKAIDYGADYVLVVGRQPKVPKFYKDRCWIEPLTMRELEEIPQHQWAVWNSRDLSSLKDLPGIPRFLLQRWIHSAGGDRKRESFREARMAFKGNLCQASNLTTIADIQPGADAVLVGSNLEIFAKSLGIRV